MNGIPGVMVNECMVINMRKINGSIEYFLKMKKLQKTKRTLIGGILVIFLWQPAQAQTSTIRSGNLSIEINQAMESHVGAGYSTQPLMDTFAPSEYLLTTYGSVKEFPVTSREQSDFSDGSGKGTKYIIKGLNPDFHIEKQLTITTYDQFSDAAYFEVSYINRDKRSFKVIKWVNNDYSLIPSKQSPNFWSFQGSSSSARADWILKVNSGFYQKNFMGMNDADYGGGIPVTDLWRPDVGIAVGHVEKVPRLVSLPVNYDVNKGKAEISVEYEYDGDRHQFNPRDTLHSYKTFVSVHQKDCFSTLREFAKFMDTQGIRPAPSESSAFEPVWCAWGYERDFTLDEIIKTLPKLKELGIKWVGIDDGYQQAQGDWHTNKTQFPGGDAQMKQFVDRLHSEGFKVVLWWAPLAVSPDSKLLKNDPHLLLVQKDGSPQFITWWKSWYMSPTYKGTLEHTKDVVNLFFKEWRVDALKMDGQHQNAVSPDYARNHDIKYPEEASEKLPLFYKYIFTQARDINPNAVLEICPCGDCMSFYNMPYTNQFVASDPESSWQVRLKGKVYKALMPETAYFGDHVELTDSGQDFASQFGVGAVPGTKFVWPATGVKSKDKNLLTPEKEKLFKKWISLYNA
jgi:alpha-galactosidase